MKMENASEDRAFWENWAIIALVVLAPAAIFLHRRTGRRNRKEAMKQKNTSNDTALWALWAIIVLIVLAQVAARLHHRGIAIALAGTVALLWAIVAADYFLRHRARHLTADVKARGVAAHTTEADQDMNETMVRIDLATLTSASSLLRSIVLESVHEERPPRNLTSAERSGAYRIVTDGPRYDVRSIVSQPQ